MVLQAPRLTACLSERNLHSGEAPRNARGGAGRFRGLSLYRS